MADAKLVGGGLTGLGVLLTGAFLLGDMKDGTSYKDEMQIWNNQAELVIGSEKTIPDTIKIIDSIIDEKTGEKIKLEKPIEVTIEGKTLPAYYKFNSYTAAPNESIIFIVRSITKDTTISIVRLCNKDGGPVVGKDQVGVQKNNNE